MKMKFFSFLISLFVSFNSFGQQKIGLESLVPPAPNAAELGKYGTYPVSLVTGIPEINIPLYEITSGSLKLPITLSYHASGIQVNQMSTDVGLGWSIMAGGTISRTVYGAPDNSTYGYFNYTPPSSATLNGITNFYTMQLYSNPGYDLEPDLFAYNIAGKSGKFIYNSSQAFSTIPFDPIKITKSGTGASLTFLIVDDNGTIFNFAQSSSTQSEFSSIKNTLSTWYLTSITSADLTNTISFQYEAVSIIDQMVQQDYPVGKVFTYNNNNNGIATESFSTGDPLNGGTVKTITSNNQYNELLIKKIIFKDGYVQFNRNTLRKDVAVNSQRNSLDEILVYNNAGQVIKKIAFAHNYFLAAPFLDDWAHYRLKLTGVTESDASATITQTHTFDYDVTSLPQYGSYNMDYWGYNNGSGNSSLIPTAKVYPEDINQVSFADGSSYSNNIASSATAYWSVGAANREPSSTYTTASILNKITYPTGGYSVFEYEANKYLSDNYVTQSVTKGGSSAGINSSTKSTTSYSFSFPSNSAFASLNSPYMRASINLQFSPSNISNTEYGKTQLVTLTDITAGTSQTWEHTGDLTVSYSVNTSIFLYPNHSYQLTNDIYGTSAVTISSTISWIENTSTHLVKEGGGLRIKSIKNYSSNNTLANEDDYVYGNGENGLGVKLFDERNFYKNYEDVVSAYYLPIGTGGVCTQVSGGNARWQRHFLGISKYNTLNYMGSPVLYSTVTKYEGTSTANTGKTIYNFNIVSDPVNFPSEFINSGNYGSVNNAWIQGELLNQTAYKNNGGQYVPVSMMEYEYGRFNQTTQNGIIVKQYKQFVPFNNCTTYTEGPEIGNTHMGEGFFSMYQYPIKSGASRKTKETRTVYDQVSGNPVKLVTTYNYQNAANLYLTQTAATISDGNIKINRIKYPQDMSDVVSTAMVAKNILSPQLEVKTIKSVSGTETLLSTVQTNYKQVGNLFVKDNVKASINANTPETRIQFNQYDVYGNILEQQKVNDVKHSYIWDYQSTLPVAEATNASQADIAYTSFDADGKGSWVFTGTAAADATAVTGGNSYNLAQTSGTITRAGLTSAITYTVSYWSNTAAALTIAGTISGYPILGRSVNGWYYHEHKITGVTSLSIAGSCKIDELRLYPSSAQMTTYTYIPLVGMSSQCDINNRITYYVYDGLQRLTVIKDQDGNVVKKICYSYAGQTTACPN